MGAWASSWPADRLARKAGWGGGAAKAAAAARSRTPAKSEQREIFMVGSPFQGWKGRRDRAALSKERCRTGARPSWPGRPGRFDCKKHNLNASNIVLALQTLFFGLKQNSSGSNIVFSEKTMKQGLG